MARSTHDDISTAIPSELQSLAGQIRALPDDAPEGLEARTFEASVVALRHAREHRGGVLARIGPVRWMAPIAAAAVVGLLAWAGATWLVPPSATSPDPSAVSVVALDEHIDEALEYANLFGGSNWNATLAEDAEELEDAWEPTVESWSWNGEMGAG